MSQTFCRYEIGNVQVSVVRVSQGIQYLHISTFSLHSHLIDSTPNLSPEQHRTDRVTWGKTPRRGKAPNTSKYEFTYASVSIS